MNNKDRLAVIKKWNKRALIISIYHKRMLIRHSKWSVRLTASKLGISTGQVCESIKLAKCITENPDLESLSRKKALAYIKNG